MLVTNFERVKFQVIIFLRKVSPRCKVIHSIQSTEFDQFNMSEKNWKLLRVAGFS